MKKSVIILVSAFLIFFADKANAQFTFTVNPGLNYNGANFGYKIGKFLPYIGAQYYGGSSKYIYEGTEWDNQTMSMQSFSDEYEYKMNLILPTIGTRFYFLEKNDLRAFANVNITKPIVTAKYIDNGAEDPDVTDFVKNISVWAGEAGFGAEYSFAPQFSISGEFGLRWIRFKYEDEFDSQVFNPMTGLDETHDFSFRSTAFMSPTYSRISLNFYFGSPKLKQPAENE